MSKKSNHFNVTEIKIASLCPRKFIINRKYRKNVFRGNSSGIGTFIHEIISNFAQKVVKSQIFIQKISNASEDQLEPIFENAFREVLIEFNQTKDLTKWKETDIELASNSMETIITELLKRFQDLRKKLDPVQALNKLFFRTEEPFIHRLEITIDKKTKILEIGGRIDWITADADNKEVTIWDFKTSSDEYLERDIAQVVIYSIMIKEIFEVDTSAALLYISADKTTPYPITSDKINKIKGSVLKTIYNMSEWMKEKTEIPFTPYQDACEDCIVKKFCYLKYGSNIHLDAIGYNPKITEKEIESDEDLNEENSDKNESEEIKSQRITKKNQSDSELDHTRRIASETDKETLYVGNILNDKSSLEIHPNVFLRHAVTIGASGSGKTVLGKVIIEELLNLGYSAILIDPQGDLCSLVLPGDDKGKELVKKTNTKIYTPNSSKGIKLTIDPLSPPGDEVIQDQDTFLTYLDATATQLLDILGYNLAKSPPEKALLESILKEEWTHKNSIDLQILADKILETTVIKSTQNNAEIEIEKLISSKQQKDFSKKIMKLVIGTEGSFFSGGEEIDFKELASNKSQLSIINLKTVGTDPKKRQLVVSWFLRSIYDWLLRNPQKEQDQIRFFLYIDEVADFLPPHPNNPPSKQMLMLLMRQARKYGCPVLLATQSPASIDYKAVDNVGTIFLGKITTQQSLNKVETFLAPYGNDTQRLTKNLQTSKVGEFVMIGGGDTKPQLFKSRWLHTKHQNLDENDIEKYYKKKNNGKY